MAEPSHFASGFSSKGCRLRPSNSAGGLIPASSVRVGVDIHKLDYLATGLSIAFCARSPNEKRSTSPLLEECTFLPDTIVFAEVISMVTPEDNDGVVSKV